MHNTYGEEIRNNAITAKSCATSHAIVAEKKQKQESSVTGKFFVENF